MRVFIALAPSAGGIEDTSIGLRALGVACVAAGAGRGRQLVIAAEVALTVTVLTTAGLAARSFWNLRSVDPGFRIVPGRRAALVDPAITLRAL